MMATLWLTPDMPNPFLTAPMVPATWVPCELSSNTDTWLPLMKPHPRMSSMQPADRVVRWGVSSQSCWGPEFRETGYKQEMDMYLSGHIQSAV